jgi:hypothetical protein
MDKNVARSKGLKKFQNDIYIGSCPFMSKHPVYDLT